ncbi:MAG TPA: hypothetical protein VEB64_00310, partial [Azospirillaceae bacterium]|nr:hypothetical protein [Azospirillaceae bacterium]
MGETKLTATLPHLTMEIIHREMPEENAEGVTIHLKATPNFQTVAGFMGAPGSLPNPWLPLMAMWANPLAS